jgi:hypothetical protein
MIPTVLHYHAYFYRLNAFISDPHDIGRNDLSSLPSADQVGNQQRQCIMTEPSRAFESLREKLVLKEPLINITSLGFCKTQKPPLALTKLPPSRFRG